jgi:4-hydroxy-2-oxoheptanedioate aldolase
MAELPRLNGIIRALESGQHALTCFSPAEVSSAVALATSCARRSPNPARSRRP